jgi:hypothetical protein
MRGFITRVNAILHVALSCWRRQHHGLGASHPWAQKIPGRLKAGRNVLEGCTRYRCGISRRFRVSPTSAFTSNSIKSSLGIRPVLTPLSKRAENSFINLGDSPIIQSLVSLPSHDLARKSFTFKRTDSGCPTASCSGLVYHTHKTVQARSSIKPLTRALRSLRRTTLTLATHNSNRLDVGIPAHTR